MDDKSIRSALLKQLTKDIGSNRIKSYGPKDEDLKEMDPKDVEGTGFEDKLKKAQDPAMRVQSDDSDEDDMHEGSETPEEIKALIEEARAARREKANKALVK